MRDDEDEDEDGGVSFVGSTRRIIGCGVGATAQTSQHSSPRGSGSKDSGGCGVPEVGGWTWEEFGRANPSCPRRVAKTPVLAPFTRKLAWVREGGGVLGGCNMNKGHACPS